MIDFIDEMTLDAQSSDDYFTTKLMVSGAQLTFHADDEPKARPRMQNVGRAIDTAGSVLGKT